MKHIVPALAVFAALLLVLSPSPASAGFYYGGSVGQSSADISAGDLSDGSGLSNTSVEDTDTEWKLFGGYKFFKFFAVEASYGDMGEVSASADSDGLGLLYTAGPVSSNLSATGYTVSTLGTLPVGSNWDVFAKFGLLFWDADVRLSNAALPGGSITGSDSGNDAIFGAGVVWDYTGPGQMRFEYETGSAGDVDIDSLSAGLSFRF